MLFLPYQYFPFIILILFYILDGVDYYTIKKDYRKKIERHIIDKFIDLMNYIFVMIYLNLIITDIVILIVFYSLFVYRAIGNVLFIIKQDRKIFLYFINLFMILSLIYIFLDIFLPDLMIIFQNYIYFLYLIYSVLIFSVFKEIVIHYLFTKKKYEAKKEVKFRKLNIKEKLKTYKKELELSREERKRFIYETISLTILTIFEAIMLILAYPYNVIFVLIIPILTFLLSFFIYKIVIYRMFYKSKKEGK